MGGTNPADLVAFLEQFGVPGALALVSIWFLIHHLRTDRGPPPEPHWAADIREKTDRTDAHVRRIMTDLQRTGDGHTRQLSEIQSMVQEIRTTLRIRSGQRGGD